MEDSSLDDFISDSVSTGTEGVSPHHLKLRKIKRPKIKNENLPPAPDKFSAMPNYSELSNEADEALINETLDMDEQLQQPGTDLVTSLDAHTAPNPQEYSSPYVLEGLPPELDEEDFDDENDDISEDTSGYASNKKLFLIVLACFFVGLFLGSTLFSSKTEEKHGLENIVLNPDVPTGRPRCGLTDKSQACVFYLMNWYKQELTGRDFYKLVAQLTGRAESMIETENLRYATMKIRPGYFAQLNIPALK